MLVLVLTASAEMSQEAMDTVMALCHNNFCGMILSGTFLHVFFCRSAHHLANRWLHGAS
jgi:hypothetical protein